MTDPEIYNANYYDDMRGADESGEIYRYFLDEFSEHIDLDGVVLDAGCGRGELLRLFAARPDGISYGLDFSEVAVEYTKNVVKSISGMGAAERVICGSITDAEIFPKQTFDTVFMMDIVEHLEQQQLISGLQNVRNWLSLNGNLCIHTFPTKVPHYIYQQFLRATGNRLELSKLNSIHCNVQTQKSLRSSLETAGFVIEKMWLRNDLTRASSTFQNMSEGTLKSIIAWSQKNVIDSSLFCSITSMLRVDEVFQPSIYAICSPN